MNVSTMSPCQHSVTLRPPLLAPSRNLQHAPSPEEPRHHGRPQSDTILTWRPYTNLYPTLGSSLSTSSASPGVLSAERPLSTHSGAARVKSISPPNYEASLPSLDGVNAGFSFLLRNNRRPSRFVSNSFDPPRAVHQLLNTKVGVPNPSESYSHRFC
jgi:hypothetical protein